MAACATTDAPPCATCPIPALVTASPSPNHTPSDTRIPSSEVVVRVFGRTDVGRTREHNEDAFVVADLTAGNATLLPELRTHTSGERGTLFMVADGMGGAASGEIASSMAVDVVLDQLREWWCGDDAPPPEPAAFAAALREATEAANVKIHEFAKAHPENRGMGTTATIAGLLGDTLYMAQVGDSRAYLIRDGVARQLTKDQSLMQKLIEAGEITAEEAETSDRRNIILQALGPEPYIKIDLTHQQVRRGDTLVLCSDGLSGQVRPEEIAQMAAQVDDPMLLCKQLIDRANATGGPDNITVVVARFDGAGLDHPVAEDHVGHHTFALEGDDDAPGAMQRHLAREQPGGGLETERVAPLPRETRRAYVYVLLFAAAIAVTYVVVRLLQ